MTKIDSRTIPDVAYTPGWTPDAVAMLSARRAGERAGAILRHLPDAETVLDVGCGPGTITAGLTAARTVVGIDVNVNQLAAARNHGRSTAATSGSSLPSVWFVAAAATELPCPSGSVDVYFSHALYEHLPDPAAALAEAHRVLRPGGRLAIVASDWSRARFDPHTADVDTAVHAHREVRRRTGADPDAGGRLPGWIATAGFTVDEVHHHQRVDLTYAGLAAYIASRLADPDAAAAARRWQRTSGTWTQCWTEVLAHR